MATKYIVNNVTGQTITGDQRRKKRTSFYVEEIT